MDVNWSGPHPATVSWGLPGPWARLLGVLLVACLVIGSARAARADATGSVSAAALQDVLIGLAASDRTRRLQAVNGLASLISIDPKVGTRALPRLRAILKLRGPDERAAVVPLLVRIPDSEARALWLRRLDPAVESNDVVLAAAVGATRQVPRDANLTKRLLKQAVDTWASACRRALAIEALGHMDSPAVPLLLARARRDETWVEAAARALALGTRRCPASIPPLLDLLEHAALGARIHAWESLVRLTGRDLPGHAAPWRAWWEKQDRARLPERPQPKAAGPRYAAKKPTHVPHYYDIPIPRPGSHVVFCLDASQSMYGSGIDDARRHLKKTLMEFPSTHAFEIVVFNERVLPWARHLVRAHPVQKFLAMRLLDDIEPTSYTNLYDAVETAFGYGGRGPRAVERPVRLDAIFLLSDGAPNRGRFRTHDRVVKHIRRLSGGEMPVYTIGAGEEVFPLLRAIAKATGARFVDAFE